jgi:SAM-dependent methyltransferase
MKQDPIENIRESYDRIADEYARRMFHELDGKPFDREQLMRFANLVKDRGLVCDMGCGPGHIARFLQDAGTNVFGLDLSPQMIARARQLNPKIEFREGNMLALDLEQGVLAGIAAFYAIVNIPAASLPLAFAEMHRVLQAGGFLLLAFHIGDEVIRAEELWGKQISMEFHHLQPRNILAMLTKCGFAIEDVIERDPYSPDVEFQSRRAYVFAVKGAVQALRSSAVRKAP